MQLRQVLQYAQVREASRINVASTAKEMIHHSLFTINSQQSAYTLSVLGNWSLWIYCSSHFSSQGGLAIRSIICNLHIYKLAPLSNSQVVFQMAFWWSLWKDLLIYNKHIHFRHQDKNISTPNYREEKGICISAGGAYVHMYTTGK